MFFFISAILVYVFGCYVFARFYFALVAYINQSTWKASVKKGVVAICFLGFVITEIPLAIFLPAWLSFQTGFLVNDHGREPTTMLIIFGCIVLATTLWCAWRSKEGRRFAGSLASHIK